MLIRPRRSNTSKYQVQWEIDPGSTAHQLHELQERKHPTRAWPKSYRRTKRRRKILHPPRNIRSTRTSLHREIQKAQRTNPLGRRSSADFHSTRQRLRKGPATLPASPKRQDPTHTHPETLRGLPLPPQQQTRLQDQPNRRTLQDRTQPRQHACDNAPANGRTLRNNKPNRKTTIASGRGRIRR